MRLVLGQDEIVAAWMEGQTGRRYPLYYERNGAPAQAVMGWCDERGAIHSAAYFVNHQDGGSIEIHICGRLTRGCIRDAYRYAFNQLGVKRVTALIERSHKLLRKKLHKLGFKYEATIKNQYSEGDALMFRLDRAAAERWM
jgi:RimJ/RimL family protein N-acetyltransferase